MYRKAQRHQDFMQRSNRFVDRILAGGNRLDTSAILAETDADLLLDALERLEEIRLDRRTRFQARRDEKAAINNETKGMPEAKIPASQASIRRRAITAYKEALSALEEMEWRISLVQGRLISLGVAVPDNPSYSTTKERHQQSRSKIRPGSNRDAKRGERWNKQRARSGWIRY